jgi:hypothetical protein
MGIDIAAMDAATKLAYAQALGSVLIASGSISAPTAFVDIDLPSSYNRFLISLADFDLSSDAAFGYLAAGFSADGGSTFYCDTDNFDTYGYTGYSVNGGSLVGSGDIAQDSLMNLSLGLSGPQDIDLLIYPGSASRTLRMVMERSVDGYAVNGSFGLQRTLNFLNPEATLPPTYARMNLIRLSPYGNGDTPPTSSERIISGSWFLYGYATP